MDNYYNELTELLRKNEKFVAEDGSIMRNAVYEAAMNNDEDLVRSLLSNTKIKECFFDEVDDVLVFDKIKFGWVINNKQFLPDSYTRYKNKIGFENENGELLSYSDNIEFVFPYKDCILEGDQSDEDQIREELFYNETLSPDKVDRLLYPKCFSNAKKYDEDGEQAATKIGDNDNLIIKGNNLLALASLEKRYSKEIKCIYIDPPYYFKDNKSADTFGYNSNFKLSTWLVFMKNRLTIAKKLLSKDGSIWISVGKDGQHYLKVLADDIFGADCFVADISWQKTYSPRNDARGISSEVESILVYSKNPNWKPNKLPRTKKMNSVYKNPDDDHTLWRTSDAFAPSAVTHQGMVYAIQHPVTGELIYPYNGACWPLEQNKMLEEMSKWANYEFVDIDDDERRAQVCGIPTESVRKNVKAIMLSEPLESAKKKALNIIERGQWPKFFFTKKGYGGIARKTYLDDSKGKVVTNFWSYDESGHTDEAKKEISSIFGDKLFSTPKPERLIVKILQVATKEGDLILDYHLGSGTTCSVAHQMNRRYIGIEQMDYIKSLCVERLKYNISGGETNISESINWKGGGSFIYCELAQLNQKVMEDIEKADDDKMIYIYNEMIKSGFISYKIDPSAFADNLTYYEELSLKDKKRFLLEILDKNLLYVNYCDMNDKEFNISSKDKEFTKNFYKEG